MGDHEGPLLFPGAVGFSCVGPGVPLAPTAQIWLLAEKAISLPVGYHSGSASGNGKFGPTTTVLPLPSAFIT